MVKLSKMHSGNTVELRPSLKSVIRVTIESIPILGDFFHRYYTFPRRGNACRGVFSTYDEAKGAILESGESDYELCHVSRSIDAEVERKHEISFEDYPVLFWLRGLIGHNTKIADLGGSTGGTFYAFADALNLPEDAEWLVAELPTAVDLGTRVAAARGETRICFTTELGPEHHPDVLLTIGAIQYMPVSLPEILSKLATLPDNVIVHKVPVTDGPAFWTIQGLSITEVPYYIHNRSDLVKGIEALGYRLVDSCKTQRKIRIPFKPGHDVDGYAGLFFQRIDNHIL